MENIRINSNINLYYIPMTKLKTTTIGVYMHRALEESEVSENAILPYVLKRGCKLCPDSESIAKYLENMYGARLGAYSMKMGGDQITYIGCETISDKYAQGGEKLVSEAIKLIMSILFEPVSFDTEILEQEKKNAVDRIMAEMNDKALYALRRCTEEMCKGDSFSLSILGKREGIENITAQSLKKHYDRIINSSVIDIYVCGECDPREVCNTAEGYVTNIKFKEAALPKCDIFKADRAVQRVTDKMEVAQGKLCMGFRTGIDAASEDYTTLMVLNSIYGGGAHSKLFNNVREKLSLCYYASSSIVKNKGLMFVNAGIEFENFDKAYDEIIVQLEAVKNGDISDSEFSSSVAHIMNELESDKDSQAQLQLFCLGQRVSGTDYDIDELKEKIKCVTVEDVKRVAEKIELDTVYFLTGKGAE